jgi:hypothetical protein
MAAAGGMDEVAIPKVNASMDDLAASAGEV